MGRQHLKLLFIVAAVAVLSTITVDHQYSYTTFDFSGKYLNRLSDYQSPWNVGQQDLIELSNLRYDPSGRLQLRRGWKIVSTAALPTGSPYHVGETTVSFLYSNAGTFDRQTLVGTNNAGLYKDAGASYTNLFTGVVAAGDTWNFTPINNSVVVARGSTSGLSFNLTVYDPTINVIGNYAIEVGITKGVTLTGVTPVAGGSIPTGTHYCYLATYKKYTLDEGGADYEKAIQVGLSGANLTARVDVPEESTDPNIKGYKYFDIYRADVVNAFAKKMRDVCGTFYRVKEIPTTTSTWDDDGTTTTEDLDLLTQPDYGIIDVPYTFKYCDGMHGRLWCAGSTDGASGASPPGVLYYTDVACIHCWRATQYLVVGKDRGERIQCLKHVRRGMFIGTDKATYFVDGTSPADYLPTLISDKIGCSSNWSVVESNGILYWYFSGMVYELDGNQIIRIGDDVSAILNSVSTTAKDYFLAHAVADDPAFEIWFFLNDSATTYPTTALVWNYRFERWTKWQYLYRSGSDVTNLQVSGCLYTPNTAPDCYFGNTVAADNKRGTFDYQTGDGVSTTGASVTYQGVVGTGTFGDPIDTKKARKMYIEFTDPGVAFNYYTTIYGQFEAKDDGGSMDLTEAYSALNTGYQMQTREEVDATVKGKYFWMCSALDGGSGNVLPSIGRTTVQYYPDGADE